MHPGTFASYPQYPAHYDSFPSQQYALPPAQYYSVDVECVATGLDHNARAVAQISLVVRIIEPAAAELKQSLV